MLDCHTLIFSQNKNWSEDNKRLFGIWGGWMDFNHQRTGQFYTSQAFDQCGTCNPYTLTGHFKSHIKAPHFN